MPTVVLASPDKTRVSETITFKSLDVESRVSSFLIETFLSLLQAAQGATSPTPVIGCWACSTWLDALHPFLGVRGSQMMRRNSRVGGIVVEMNGNGDKQKQR
jgi:hypothetical protein